LAPAAIVRLGGLTTRTPIADGPPARSVKPAMSPVAVAFAAVLPSSLSTPVAVSGAPAEEGAADATGLAAPRTPAAARATMSRAVLGARKLLVPSW
jgi:hypothetical protein